ncbi:zinc-binding dehydrogenase [Occultella kanbiaonis]|uniref:zinc-binding dehydrogenase n=1 Tax=Occultella kanbiaonis TaxID=2675754 RepID=UPI0039A6FCF3
MTSTCVSSSTWTAASAAWAEVADAAARGELSAHIGRRYTLDEGPRAVADFATRHTTGKLVVRI